MENEENKLNSATGGAPPEESKPIFQLKHLKKRHAEDLEAFLLAIMTKEKADEFKSQKDMTPLIFSCSMNFTRIAQRLLQLSHANVDAVNNIKKSALYYAFENGNTELVTMLLRHASAYPPLTFMNKVISDIKCKAQLKSVSECRDIILGYQEAKAAKHQQKLLDEEEKEKAKLSKAEKKTHKGNPRKSLHGYADTQSNVAPTVCEPDIETVCVNQVPDSLEIDEGCPDSWCTVEPDGRHKEKYKVQHTEITVRSWLPPSSSPDTPLTTL